MSVWASFGIFDGEEDQPRPIRYLQSHIVPSPHDERAGSVDLALIPGFVTRDGRDDSPDDAPWPYLRVSVADSDDAEGVTVVLDDLQVAQLRDELDVWLCRVHRHDQDGAAS